MQLPRLAVFLSCVCLLLNSCLAVNVAFRPGQAPAGYPTALRNLIAAVDNWIQNPPPGPNGAPSPVTTASLVRLAFHDCVGGCDSCVNIANPSNNGLQGVVQALTGFYNNLASQNALTINGKPLSRADFWALAFLRAVVVATPGANGPFPVPLRFLTGRLSCPSTNSLQDTTEGTLPAGTLNFNGVNAFFNTPPFQFTPQEITALLGAHSLGRARSQNSGFQGVWDNSPASLDNQYYVNLLPNTATTGGNNGGGNPGGNNGGGNPGGNNGNNGGGNPGGNNGNNGGGNPGGNMGGPAPPPPPRKADNEKQAPGAGPQDFQNVIAPNQQQAATKGLYQWSTGGNVFMLDADMSLVKTFPQTANGQVACTYQGATQCPNNAATLGTVQRYATNQNQWWFDFGNVFTKLVETVTPGQPALTDPFPGQKDSDIALLVKEVGAWAALSHEAVHLDVFTNTRASFLGGVVAASVVAVLAIASVILVISRRRRAVLPATAAPSN